MGWRAHGDPVFRNLHGVSKAVRLFVVPNAYKLMCQIIAPVPYTIA